MSATEQFDFTLDGRSVNAQPGETILQAAQRQGVQIPRLCYADNLRADGNCRACVVEIDGERSLAPSCCRAPSPGMVVQASSERAIKSQKMVLELLLADLPEQGSRWVDGDAARPHGELSDWADRLGVTARPALVALRREQPAPDLSHPAMAVNLDACIQCTRCVRACRETQMNDVIGMLHRGAGSQIAFDLGDAMGDSSCVGCGECVQACPTGALSAKTLIGDQRVDKVVDSVCPFCGVGCLLSYQVRDNRIVAVQGRKGPANDSRLCVKGRFGFDYVHNRQRLLRPLIRKPGVAKDSKSTPRPEDWHEVFREASWDEALALAGGGLKALRDQHGPKTLAGFGSAKGSNEEAYLFQKLVRTGFGSNNVDHCTRLCHASSVAALLEGVGSGAVSNPVNDVQHAELILVIGANPTSNHPVAATWMKNAAARGTKIVVADPRRTDLARHAWRSLQFNPDTDVALLNAMIHTVIAEGLTDQDFIRDRASNFEALKANVAGYTPERMAPICGIAAETIREVARAFAGAKSAMVLWGMGVSQHVHGTDNARCLIALALMTGQIGRPGTGLHPLRGQNNVQGASDAGLIPMMLPDYQHVSNPAVRAKFESAWKLPAGSLDEQPGLTVVEVMHAIKKGVIRGMYVQGENPAMSDPDANHARESLAALEHLVVQDIFLTETAYLADVILPASAFPEKDGSFTNTDRLVQMGRKAINPPGAARQDLWIIQQIGNRLGLDWQYKHVSEVFDEMRHTMPSIGGITWERLEREHSVTYPCLKEGDPGQSVVFEESFPRETGRARFVPADIIPANERPDTEYPMVLITGRQLEHWHTGSMTRRATVLDAIEPDPVALVHPLDLADMGGQPGDLVTIESRRGKVALYARADESSPRGAVFVPFCYYEAAINKLTNAALDPFAKIPEFKYCAIRVSLGGVPPVQSSYGGGQALADSVARG